MNAQQALQPGPQSRTGETRDHEGRAAEMLLVQVADQQFAIDIMSVREIRGWTTATPLPNAPDYVRGMINLRGVVLAIIDMGARLGLDPAKASASCVVVVVEFESRMVGLLVDAVCDIVNVTDDMIQATPDIGQTNPSETLKGVMTIDERIISIVSMADIIPEQQNLDAA